MAAVLGLEGEIATVAPHVDFVRIGEQVGHSSLLIDGLAGRFGQNGDGGRQITCFYIAGDMADLMSLMSPTTGWGMMALTPMTILKVPHAELRQLTLAYPGIAEAFWRDSVADGSILSEWVVNVGRRDSITRVAHVFCEMALRFEQAGLGDRISYPFYITQADLADATGLTSIHVNRTLKVLRERSIVDFRLGVVRVHDWTKLVAIGDFDPAFLLLNAQAPRIAERG
ncbi:Crp/Fnr family transcriptional regulator [Sphingomonas sp. S1-29]|uniref:Crp/Fnr family transcriptional regulator n=1 Tax=Sphingomonas sp. S1-29 TaxID=2991074 RepID=UPI0022402387|nr:Crp/Fnr family transcriptional regulator [Sphingomonas sp. S1-29]UZK68817.1 Crp/Fnr family transcriptional regulator [Sphingomonas sp. S1-29]